MNSTRTYEQVLTQLRDSGVLEHGGLSEDAILVYILGLMVQADDGLIPKADLEAAMDDGTMVGAAFYVMLTATGAEPT